MTDTQPHVSPHAIGSIPAITVKFPQEFPLALLAALMARAGFRIRWIRRGKHGDQA